MLMPIKPAFVKTGYYTYTYSAYYLNVYSYYQLHCYSKEISDRFLVTESHAESKRNTRSFPIHRVIVVYNTGPSMESNSNDGQILLARQPIFDKNLKVVACELLYRDELSGNSAIFADDGGSSATSAVVLNVYTSISQCGEIKHLPAFINLTRELIINGYLPKLPKDRVVLEILEDVEVDDQLIEAISQLAKQGYRIALDDFVYSPEYDPLLEIAHIVKVDVFDLNIEQVRDQIELLKPFNVTLLAEKIETHEMMNACIDLGFKLFQGYFLCKPQIVKGKKLESSHYALMKLIQELQNSKTTPARLEELIITDPVLSYRLLRIVNSASHTLVRQVNSISEAVVLLGLTQVRKWATLIAMTSANNKPDELYRIVLLRGRMCEIVAEQLSMSNTAAYFMAGMLSGLDALLDIDKTSLLSEIPLDDEIKAAIYSGDGIMGDVLNNVLNYEQGAWALLPSDLNTQIYDDAYRESLLWTQDAMQSLSDDD